MADRWSERRLRLATGVLSIVLVVGGSLATGLFPSTTPYQVLAGAVIVAGFAVGYAALALPELLEWLEK